MIAPNHADLSARRRSPVQIGTCCGGVNQVSLLGKWSVLVSLFLSLSVGFGLALMTTPRIAKNRSPVEARTLDGRPDLNGIWQVLNTAEWDLLPHEAGSSPVVALGTTGAEPPGLRVVEGDDI